MPAARARKNEAGPDKFGDDDVKPATATAGRRHRPSTKAVAPNDASDRQKKPGRATGRMKSRGTGGGPGRGSKRGLKSQVGVRVEDKREDPDEMSTDAAPKNLIAERDDKARKGKSTHALESTSKAARPSRKSTRRAANHMKRDSQQRRQQTREVRSPKARHASASG